MVFGIWPRDAADVGEMGAGNNSRAGERGGCERKDLREDAPSRRRVEGGGEEVNVL